MHEYLDTNTSVVRTVGEWVVGRGSRNGHAGWIVYPWREPSLGDTLCRTLQEALQVCAERRAR